MLGGKDRCMRGLVFVSQSAMIRWAVLQEGGLYGVAEISCRCGML